MKQGINLIPRTILTARARRARARAWVVADAALGVTMAAVLALSHPESSGLVERLRAEHEEARSSLAGAQESLARTVVDLREARNQEAIARRLGARPEFSGLLRTIALELDPRATLDQVLIAPLVVQPDAPSPGHPATPPDAGVVAPPAPEPVREQYRVLISGLATSAGVASEFVLRLERSGYFESVKLTSTSGRELGDVRAVEFNISGVLGEGRVGGLAASPEKAPPEGDQ